jgi:hypothetical protein
MSLHINRFIDRLKAVESKNQRDFYMTMIEARDLHADITKLLLAVQLLQEKLVSQNANTDSAITVEMQGGTF